MQTPYLKIIKDYKKGIISDVGVSKVIF